MQITVTLMQPSHITALARAVEAFNTTRPGSELTTEQFVQRLVDQHVATYAVKHTKKVLTKFEFLNRFTQTERVAIRAAAASNGSLADFMQMLEIATDVDVTNEATVAGVTFLETVGLLAAGRAAEILAV